MESGNLSNKQMIKVPTGTIPDISGLMDAINKKWGDISAPDNAAAMAAVPRMYVPERLEISPQAQYIPQAAAKVNGALDDLPTADEYAAARDAAVAARGVQPESELPDLPEKGVGANATDFERKKVVNQDYATQGIAGKGLTPEAQANIGIGEQTHIVYPDKEAAYTAKNSFEAAFQRTGSVEGAADDFLSTVKDGHTWTRDDVELAKTVEENLQRLRDTYEPGSAEYETANARLKTVYERHSAGISDVAGTLRSARDFTEDSPVSMYEHLVQKRVKDFGDFNKGAAKKARGLADDLAEMGSFADGPQDEAFGAWLKENGYDTGSEAGDRLAYTAHLVQDTAAAHKVKLDEGQARKIAARVDAGGDADSIYNEVVRQVNKFGELDDETTALVNNLAERMKDMPDSKERAKLEQQMCAALAQALPAKSWFDKFNNFRYTRLLQYTFTR